MTAAGAASTAAMQERRPHSPRRLHADATNPAVRAELCGVRRNLDDEIGVKGSGDAVQ
jgi:hypothetical protein